MRRVNVVFAVLSMVFGVMTSAGAQVLPNAVDVVNLPFQTVPDFTPMSVAYIPSFGRYYGAHGGNGSGSPVEIWSGTGAPLGTPNPVVDNRGLYFNSNTTLLESVSYSACCSSGAGYGIFSLNLDGTGGLNGTHTMLLAGPLADLGYVQTMPSYDPITNHLFAKQVNAGVVNVVARSNGALVTTVTLDLGAAGVASASDVHQNFVGFTGVAGEELALYHLTAKRVLVFSLAGAYVGASALPASLPVDPNFSAAYGCGYANGLFFVWDSSLGTNGGFRGFQVIGQAQQEAAIPVLSLTGLAALAVALAAAAAVTLRRGLTV